MVNRPELPGGAQQLTTCPGTDKEKRKRLQNYFKVNNFAACFLPPCPNTKAP